MIFVLAMSWFFLFLKNKSCIKPKQHITGIRIMRVVATDVAEFSVLLGVTSFGVVMHSY